MEEKDRMRAFQSPVRGDEIMQVCGLAPGPLVGKLKTAIEDAILDDTGYRKLRRTGDVGCG